MEAANTRKKTNYDSMRLEARRGGMVHWHNPNEPHVLDLEKGCWCDCAVEDFTAEGGGIFVVHSRITWQ